MAVELSRLNAFVNAAYRASIAEALNQPDPFLSTEAIAERRRLNRIGPLHGPYRHQVDWRTRRGRIVTHYKGRVTGVGGSLIRRTDCQEDHC